MRPAHLTKMTELGIVWLLEEIQSRDLTRCYLFYGYGTLLPVVNNNVSFSHAKPAQIKFQSVDAKSCCNGGSDSYYCAGRFCGIRTLLPNRSIVFGTNSVTLTHNSFFSSKYSSTAITSPHTYHLTHNDSPRPRRLRQQTRYRPRIASLSE